MNRLGTTGVSQLLDDLQQIADDHLVVCVAVGALGDGLRDRPRIARHLVRFALDLCVGRLLIMPRPHDRGFRQPHPELGVPSSGRPGLFVFFKRSVVGYQTEAVIRNRVQLDVWLLLSPLAWPQTQGLARLVGFLRHEQEEPLDLLLAHTLMEADGAQVVAV